MQRASHASSQDSLHTTAYSWQSAAERVPALEITSGPFHYNGSSVNTLLNDKESFLSSGSSFYIRQRKVRSERRQCLLWRFWDSDSMCQTAPTATLMVYLFSAGPHPKALAHLNCRPLSLTGWKTVLSHILCNSLLSKNFRKASYLINSFPKFVTRFSFCTSLRFSLVCWFNGSECLHS